MRLTRTAKGLSQTALGKLLGIKHPQISRYEGGKHVPRDRILAAIAACLEVRPEWLLTGKGPRHMSPGTARGKPLKVTTAPLHEGGTEVSFVLYDELREVFTQRAEREGLSLDAFLTNALLDLAKERGDDRPILELARRLNHLLQTQAAPASSQPLPRGQPRKEASAPQRHEGRRPVASREEQGAAARKR